VPPAASYALAGRVVPMADGVAPLRHGVVYVSGNTIVDVLDAGAGRPAGFETTPVVQTGGTIYPGLIELHNHLSYNVLPLWQVPQVYKNRDKWSVPPLYRKIISGPMKIVGTTVGLPESVVRYAEAKCLLGGTTTSQGIALYSNAGIRKFYFGAVRNVEDTEDPALPNAATKIPDVAAKDASKFLDRLKKLATKGATQILHLSEGTDDSAESHFQALHLGTGEWAIEKSLAGIHCVSLTRADYDVMASKGASMVWSPLSNLLLYGKTADIKAARSAGVRAGIGSDWSPSGSKNLLFELRVARLVGQTVGGISDRDLLAMATTNAAGILGWSRKLGSLEKGKLADLIVINEQTHDAYEHIFQASETDVALTVIDGVARAGSRRLMTALGGGRPTERVNIGSTTRLLDLAQDGVDPIIAGLSLADATSRLRDALHRLPELAKVSEGVAFVPPPLMLELDHEELDGFSIRPELPDRVTGQLTGQLRIPPAGLAALAQPLSEVLEPIDLDPLTVVGDADYLEVLAHEQNVPAGLRAAIGQLS
jgi:5-methylthioadenosine/S-adenosylhomocysteine deaminase